MAADEPTRDNNKVASDHLNFLARQAFGCPKVSLSKARVGDLNPALLKSELPFKDIGIG
jgi:hypothetical protein